MRESSWSTAPFAPVCSRWRPDRLVVLQERLAASGIFAIVSRVRGETVKRLKSLSVRLALVMALAICGATHVAAQGPAAVPTLAMLDRLTRGQWEVRFRPDNRVERYCIRSAREFIQLRHPESGCSRFVVEDTADRVTVQYTCRGRGYGRTFIRRETASLAQIQSQGLIDGLPFEFSAEARWIGQCG